jgi:glutathione S-transferase
MLAGEKAMTLALIIGNKNYSSWSLRPWLALAHHKIPFDETVVNIYADDTKLRILQHSPAGKVPVLHDGEATVWESLAILDYLADKFPKLNLWPADPVARGHARSVAAEMHSGFIGLRQNCPMTLKRLPRAIELTDAAKADVARITALWNDCRERYGRQGGFLFGEFSAADCMYAPVATRIRTYEVPVDLVSSAYVDAIHALPAFVAWREAALKESWTSHYDHL